MSQPALTSTRPYMIRAWHEWCSDNGLTPYLLVKVDHTVSVPREFVHDGEIVLNVGMDATGGLSLGNEEVRFKARFSGKVREIIVPVERVQAIYARETGQGMGFEVEDAPDDGQSSSEQPSQPSTLEVHGHDPMWGDGPQADASSPAAGEGGTQSTPARKVSSLRVVK